MNKKSCYSKMENITHCENESVQFQLLLYAVTYLIIFIPGLLANSIALWALCGYIRKRSKSVIFMINLAFADFAHVLSLPLRIFYYINHTWPFGHSMCMLCFYLKYLNMYASIVFLMCISIQRCVFLKYPFQAKTWKRRYDIIICAFIWIIVGLCCLPFLFMRNDGPAPPNSSLCFADLPTKQINLGSSVAMLTIAELAGFVIPSCIIFTCAWKTLETLLLKNKVFAGDAEKKRALRMVIMCALVFLFCFTPYHINFPFYLMTKLNMIMSCPHRKVILTFHPISLCLASLNCCLDPILYYFMTAEFREQLSRHGSVLTRGRLMSRESGSSIKD
ncbi:putative P2Y purinoceptor 10 [Protopterus annectens]|uniref:putative P2Y purinoceptor 10 n=1 Tax=Protopterus annectens TaxID=7888 RepID=UPI001CF95FFC|nr:putative P2Y purinoceptor 10 [Protopterus annectens]